MRRQRHGPADDDPEPSAREKAKQKRGDDEMGRSRRGPGSATHSKCSVLNRRPKNPPGEKNSPRKTDEDKKKRTRKKEPHNMLDDREK